MAGGPGFGNRRQLRIRVHVTSPGAILKLTDVVLQSIDSLVVPLRLEGTRMTAAAARSIGGKLPGSLVRVGRVAPGTLRNAAVFARILRRRMSKRDRRPIRVVMTGGAVQRCRQVIGNLARRGGSVVTAMAVSGDAGVIESGRAPSQGAVAGTTFLSRRDVVARHRGRLHADVTPPTGTGSPNHQARVLHPSRVERIGRMAGVAVVVALNMTRVLAHGRDTVVAAEATAPRLGVIYPKDRCEVINRMAELTIVPGRDMRGRSGRRADRRADRMAPGASSRGPFEHAFLMTVLAGQVAMRALELVPCCQMIELRSLD